MQVLSPIQNQILSSLKNANVLRYGEMKPSDIDNDLYNYHLQQLVKKGLVDRYEDGYTLSKEGVQYVADPYADIDSSDSFFKFNVITIVSRVADGCLEILNQKRLSNPSYGKIGVPGGVVKKEEPVLVAARRKLEAETGLLAEFRLLGIERRVLYRGGVLFSDMLFPIAHADYYTGSLQDTDFGENMWVGIEEAIINESEEYDSLVSVKRVLEHLRKNTTPDLPFFYHESIQSDK